MNEQLENMIVGFLVGKGMTDVEHNLGTVWYTDPSDGKRYAISEMEVEKED